MAKVLNFDQFISEKKRETLTVTVFGHNYEVPMEIPAIVPVMMARAEEEMDAQASTRMVMVAADSLLGKENIDEMCRNGLSAQDLSQLVQQLFQQINAPDEEESEEEEELTDADSRVETTTGSKPKSKK